jgi:hypothetical protein
MNGGSGRENEPVFDLIVVGGVLRVATLIGLPEFRGIVSDAVRR